ncbi:MAG: hypothetical protein DA408_16060 [Bacteroidetes bacterium]|nr:MAG: hypothetical protein C7N36_06600 [Bacteroidota bacterium]PTM10432.1 MAG: hypothetical protein DA408_16060 [Bacteroidota bacterium]
MENLLLNIIVILVLVFVLVIGVVRLVFRVSHPFSAGMVAPTVPGGQTGSGSSGLGIIVILGLLFLAYLAFSAGGFPLQDDQAPVDTARPNLITVKQKPPQNYRETDLIPASFYDPCAEVRDAYDHLRNQLAAEKENAASTEQALRAENRQLTHTNAARQRALADSTTALNNLRQTIRQQNQELQQASIEFAQEYEQRLLAETDRDRHASEKEAADKRAAAEQKLRLRYHLLFLGLLGLNVLGLVFFLLQRRGWLPQMKKNTRNKP